EVPRARGPAVEIALVRRPCSRRALRRRRRGFLPRGERLEDRLEPLEGALGTADHEAVAALHSPDAAARPDVEIVKAAAGQRVAAADVVLEIAVAAVDENVAGLEALAEG